MTIYLLMDMAMGTLPI